MFPDLALINWNWTKQCTKAKYQPFVRLPLVTVGAAGMWLGSCWPQKHVVASVNYVKQRMSQCYTSGEQCYGWKQRHKLLYKRSETCSVHRGQLRQNKKRRRRKNRFAIINYTKMWSSCFAKCKMWTIQEAMKVDIKQMKDLAKTQDCKKENVTDTLWAHFGPFHVLSLCNGFILCSNITFSCVKFAFISQWKRKHVFFFFSASLKLVNSKILGWTNAKRSPLLNR